MRRKALAAFRRKLISRIIGRIGGGDRELAMMQVLAKAIAARTLTIWLLLLAATTAVLASAQIAGAEEAYPSRPIRLIIPFPPGGPTDVMGRLIGQALSEQLGQQVYVDNRPGEGSIRRNLISKINDVSAIYLPLGTA